MIIDVTKTKDPFIWTPDKMIWDLNLIRNKLLSNINETYIPSAKYTATHKLTDHESSYIRVRGKLLIAHSYKGTICHNCNYQTISHFGMDYHHLDPSTKYATIGNICRGNGKNDSDGDFNCLWGLLLELDKTIPLCKICHTLVHSKSHKKDENDFSYIKNLIVKRLDINYCMNCNCTFPLSVLEAHHRYPPEKSFELSQVYMKNNRFCIKPNKKNTREREVTIKEIYAEIDKCDIICKNCHQIMTANIGLYQRHFKDIVYSAIRYINSSEINLLTNNKRKNRFENKALKRSSSKKPYVLYNPHSDEFFEVYKTVNPKDHHVNPYKKVNHSSKLTKNRIIKNKIMMDNKLKD